MTNGYHCRICETHLCVRGVCTIYCPKCEEADKATKASPVVEANEGTLAQCACGKRPRISNLEGSAIHLACRCGVQLWGQKKHFGTEEEAVQAWNARFGKTIESPTGMTVWYGSMPESNGKSNFTAILHRKDGCQSEGFTINRSEYPERVRYAADVVRYLIGELAQKPFILDYDSEKHSGYVAPEDRQ